VALGTNNLAVKRREGGNGGIRVPVVVPPYGGQWGSKTTSNEPVDFDAYGAWKVSAPGIAGTNNRAVVALHGVSRQIDGVVMPSFPADVGGDYRLGS